MIESTIYIVQSHSHNVDIIDTSFWARLYYSILLLGLVLIVVLFLLRILSVLLAGISYSNNICIPVGSLEQYLGCM